MQERRLKALCGIASVNIDLVSFRSQPYSHHAFGPDLSEAVARLGTLEREVVVSHCIRAIADAPLTVVWTAANRFAEDGKTVMPRASGSVSTGPCEP